MRKFIYALLLMIPVALMSQVTFNLRHHFGFPAARLTSIIPTDSCYYATGIIADTIAPYQIGNVFAKLNLDGTSVFVKTVFDSLRTIEVQRNTLVRLSDGTFAQSGYAYDDELHCLLMRYDAEGVLSIASEYANPFYPQFKFINPMAFSQTPDNGFVFLTWIDNTLNSGGSSDIYLFKTDSIGSIIWDKVFQNSAYDRPHSVIVTPGGRIIIGAIRTNDNSALENYKYQCHIFQTDSLGNVEWSYLSPNSIGLRDAANGMVLLEDGSLVVASGIGHEIDNPSVNTVWFDKHVFKLNSNHQNIDWGVTYKEEFLTGSAFTSNLIRLSNGSGFVAVGTSGVLDDNDNYGVRGWIAKISNNGDSLWTREYIGMVSNYNQHQFYDLKETPDSGFILCGESLDWDANYQRQQAWLLKLDSYGCLIPGCQSVGTSETGKPEVQLAIYPNPTTDYLNFQLRSAAPPHRATFRIVNAEGRVMKEIESESVQATFMVPVWDWAAGVYFLQYIESGVVLSSEKFMKQ